MLRRIGRFLAIGVGVFLAVSVLLVALYRAIPPPATPLMLIRAVEGKGIAKEWRPLAQLSPHLVRAVIASEDAKFCEHHGFDWEALSTAADRYQDTRGLATG